MRSQSFYDVDLIILIFLIRVGYAMNHMRSWGAADSVNKGILVKLKLTNQSKPFNMYITVKEHVKYIKYRQNL